jgi:hypothetical protein
MNNAKLLKIPIVLVTAKPANLYGGFAFFTGFVE